VKSRFRKHYTRDEANVLLPQVRQWLERLGQLRRTLDQCEKRLGSLTATGGDVGGELVNLQVRTLADINEVLGEFQRREVLVKDLDRGLIDFPAIASGKRSLSLLGAGRGRG
jgi:hypothetical protein